MNGMEASTISPVLQWQETMQSKQTNPKTGNANDMTPLFLKLMQNAVSDPMGGSNPAENARLMAGLLESQAKVTEGKRLKKIEEAMNANNALQAGLLVGKRAKFQSNTFTVHKNTQDELAYKVPQDTYFHSVSARIYDMRTERLVRASNLSNAPGLHSLEKTVKGLPVGTYRIDVLGIDDKRAQQPLESFVTSEITDVQIDENGHLAAGVSGTKRPLNHLRGLYAPETQRSS